MAAALTLAVPATHVIPPSVTMAALAPVHRVRHCQGAAALQYIALAATDTVAPRTAVTRPTPRAPSERYTRPWM